MHHRKTIAIALLVISLILFAFQAGIWAKSEAHARTETDMQNIQSHPPTEIPGLIGAFLLLAAAFVAAKPSSRDSHEPEKVKASGRTV
jgi:hypothetical protein